VPPRIGTCIAAITRSVGSAATRTAATRTAATRTAVAGAGSATASSTSTACAAYATSYARAVAARPERGAKAKALVKSCWRPWRPLRPLRSVSTGDEIGIGLSEESASEKSRYGSNTQCKRQRPPSNGAHQQPERDGYGDVYADANFDLQTKFAIFCILVRQGYFRAGCAP
jgi:hypothetical protein